MQDKQLLLLRLYRNFYHATIHLGDLLTGRVVHSPGVGGAGGDMMLEWWRGRPAVAWLLYHDGRWRSETMLASDPVLVLRAQLYQRYVVVMGGGVGPTTTINVAAAPAAVASMRWISRGALYTPVNAGATRWFFRK